MRFFLAGIMQGSHLGAALHHQGYRARLKTLLGERFPGAEVYDPLADHGESLAYDDATARAVFHRHNRMCREVDVVVAYLPEASMGTAIEMYEAHLHGRLVLAISPLAHNWAIKYCSDALYADLESFEQALAEGAIEKLLAARPAT